MTNIAIKIHNLDKLLAGFRASPKKAAVEYSSALRASSFFIQQRAMSYAPVGKYSGGGTLRQKIKAKALGQFSFAVIADTKYAGYVDQGTKPHVIVPRTKPFLAFQIDGRWVRTKRVNHPGTKPTYFFTNAAKDGEAYLNRALDAAVQRVFDSL